MLSRATPLAFSGPDPRIVDPLVKVTTPPGVPAAERVKLMKLAWDAIGSEFAGRHAQYEMFYAGAPFVTTRSKAPSSVPISCSRP